VKILFIGAAGVITQDRTEGRRLFVDTLGLPLKPAEGADFLYSEKLPGSRYFGVWPLSEAAQVCFGSDRWPADRPVPQAFVEFEVDRPESVRSAADELRAQGYALLHAPRTDPWGQAVVRLQTRDGLVVGISHVPWMHRRPRKRAQRPRPSRRRPRRRRP
jgi:catechol 2,3-dioxygenase-like lactoylglutathione lyase family enzyme